MDAEALHDASRAAGLPWPIRYVPRTASTNADLRALAARGEPHGTALAAGVQTAGRGRLGRTWESPAGSWALSVLLRPLLPADLAGLVALAAARVTAEACGPEYGIKWPNDVLGPGARKVAGILAELETERRRVKWVVVGIGLNVSAAPDLPTAGALETLDGRPRDPAVLLAAITAGLLRASERLGRAPEEELDAWRSRSVTLGRRVRVGNVEGLALDVDRDGALRVRDGEGTEHRVVSGDLTS